MQGLCIAAVEQGLGQLRTVLSDNCGQRSTVIDSGPETMRLGPLESHPIARSTVVLGILDGRKDAIANYLRKERW